MQRNNCNNVVIRVNQYKMIVRYSNSFKDKRCDMWKKVRSESKESLRESQTKIREKKNQKFILSRFWLYHSNLDVVSVLKERERVPRRRIEIRFAFSLSYRKQVVDKDHSWMTSTTQQLNRFTDWGWRWKLSIWVDKRGGRSSVQRWKSRRFEKDKWGLCIRVFETTVLRNTLFITNSKLWITSSDTRQIT